MTRKPFWLSVVRLLVLVVLGGLMLLPGRQRSAVDWGEVRAIAFQSDDWGLAGFVPEAAALADLERPALQAGRFPTVYWQSTLEDSAAVAGLADLLSRYRGRDGLPPVWQANYILSSLTLDARAGGGEDAERRWVQHDLPDLPPGYARPGLWSAVGAAIERGVWRPEFHGTFHYDPQRRREASLRNETARVATERGVIVFPGSARAWELGPWRPLEVLAAELDHSRQVFRRLFGRDPVSVIAPDYVWDHRCEDLWDSRGLRVIQAKREQRHARWLHLGLLGRVLKVTDRAWARLRFPARTYLERNCDLEAVQASSWQARVQTCLREILAAFDRREPAIVESHRVNFVHTSCEVASIGFQALEALFDRLQESRDDGFIFLTDSELAQLARNGTSVCRRGSQLVLRNYSSSRRVVAVSAPVDSVTTPVAGPQPAPVLGGREPGATLVFPR